MDSAKGVLVVLIRVKIGIVRFYLDKTNYQFGINQLKRLKNKTCTTENSVLYTKTLTDFERIGDHGLNIAQSFHKIREIMRAMKMLKPEVEEVE